MIDLDNEEELRLIDLFQQKAADRRVERLMQETQQSDEDRKRHRELKLKKDEAERKFEEALATSAQIKELDERLDEYDTAAVRALMANQNELDDIRKQREEMDAASYRLPDGSMVFKSEDGHHVFDQHGVELGLDIIHPEAIPDNLPRWEAKQRFDILEDTRLHERDGIHNWQHFADESREAARSGNLTSDAVAQMEKRLEQTMPDTVRRQAAGGEFAKGSVVPGTLSSTAPNWEPNKSFVPSLAGP